MASGDLRAAARKALGELMYRCNDNNLPVDDNNMVILCWGDGEMSITKRAPGISLFSRTLHAFNGMVGAQLEPCDWVAPEDLPANYCGNGYSVVSDENAVLLAKAIRKMREGKYDQVISLCS